MHEAASDGRDAYASDLCTLGLVTIEEQNLLKSFASLFIAMTKCISRAIAAGEEAIHVSANDSVQRAALDLLDRLFGAKQIQVVFDVFI